MLKDEIDKALEKFQFAIKEVLEELSWYHYTMSEGDINPDMDVNQALAIILRIIEEEKGRTLPCKHLAFKTLNGEITELNIDGDEWVKVKE